MTVSGALNGLNIVMIVDESAAALVEPLRSAGAILVAVSTPALALAYSERHPVDVVLVDLRERGWSSTPEIRALRSLTRAPIYVMTEPGDAMPEAETTVAGYFLKPVPVDALIASLGALSRRSR